MKELLVVLLLGLGVTSQAGETETGIGYSMNGTLTSNYVWRGMTQNNESGAVQGGVDLDYKGVYVGAWGSSLTNGTEADFYGGYANSAFGIDYDLGYISYRYSADKSLNFEEAYLTLGKTFLDDKLSVSASYFVGIDQATDYVEGSVGYDFDYFTVAGTYGYYDAMGQNYTATISKSLTENIEISGGFSAFDNENGRVDQTSFVALNFSI